MNLAQSIAEALLECSVSPLSQTGGIIGAGVYAIYYNGGFEPYRPIAVRNRDGGFTQPIYVGKAVPQGARKGGLSLDASRGSALRTRLNQHARSINEAENIELADFHFRCLVVDDIWIPLGENMMIEQFRPIWNTVIDGFGNNPTGIRRETQFRSAWDVLHPGRKRARNLADSGIRPDAIIRKLRAYFEGNADTMILAEGAADVETVDDEEDG